MVDVGFVYILTRLLRDKLRKSLICNKSVPMAYKLLKTIVITIVVADAPSQKMRNFVPTSILNGIAMKSSIKYLAALAAGFVATTGLAFAAPAFNVPEPGTFALVGVALVVLVGISRAGKK